MDFESGQKLEFVADRDIFFLLRYVILFEDAGVGGKGGAPSTRITVEIFSLRKSYFFQVVREL